MLAALPSPLTNLRQKPFGKTLQRVRSVSERHVRVLLVEPVGGELESSEGGEGEDAGGCS